MDVLEEKAEMSGIFLSMKTMLRTAHAIDRRSLPLCLGYNLIKQLMNVFYGVFFIRMILAALEERRGFGHVLAVLGIMFGINILYSRFHQYYNNIYLPVFTWKAHCHVDEKIMKKANSIPYDRANSPAELDRYSKVMENSSKRLLQMYQSFGLACGLLEAFGMLLYYMIRTDVFAILLSAVPLLYSYFLGEKSAEFQYGLDKKVTSFARKKEYAGRVHYLQHYAAEMRTSKIGGIVRGIYREGVTQTVAAHKSHGKRIGVAAFFELLLGDALSMVLPLAYVLLRMLWGASYLMGDFIGITQAITIFSSDVEWMLDTVLELKTASLYISDYIDYLSPEEERPRHRAGNEPGAAPGNGQRNQFEISSGNKPETAPESGPEASPGNQSGISSGNEPGAVPENGPELSAQTQFRVSPERQSGNPAMTGQEADSAESFCIRFDHVKYRYPGSPEGAYVLKDVSVDIRNGEKIAIVGRNGAGKTTFVSLLVNLISCSEGHIFLNGADINACPREELKSFFGVVCQDYQIYPISIRDNVSIGGKMGDEEVREAIKKVGLADRIRDIDALIGKEISEEGLVLSGGERQRLALARVIANKFPVVVLDEPTSALDALTERNMNRLILDALKDTGRTLLFISHKLSTTKLVDRILVFEDGRIIQEGNHAQLMEKGGLYADMYTEQSNLYQGQDI